MKSVSLKLTTVLLVMIVAITLTANNVGPLPSQVCASSGESIGVGALVVLGAWGGYKLFTGHQQQKYDDYLAQGKEYLENENYALAIKSFKSARKIKDSVKANQLLTTAQTKYQQYHYQQGKEYLEEENWELAYQEFKKVEQSASYLDSNLKKEEAYNKLRQQKLKRVAVIEFEDNSYRYDLGTRTTGFLVSDLLELEPDFLEIVERDKLSTTLTAQELAASGLITSTAAQEIGTAAQTDYLLVGKVISGEIDRDESRELLTKEDDEEVEKIRIEKAAYVEVLFKLIDATDGAVVVSKSFEETELYQQSYFEDEAQIIVSDEKLLNTALKKVAGRFANLLVKQYGLIE
ncbi:CsgG/HfaB family protein [Halanaerobacter jeridensis]|uniref:Curli production assembly/transport component CsgG n=1 Tax=Halanaerobacter jeridensis TaxID=706427 RepID=A0A938XYC4_9FIRM|nr:CsgG/HfaB family protein [Halanaerobacter jeridensis]MBM7557535.1 hypothetical protein [Halanaerobacter jeridensis]